MKYFFIPRKPAELRSASSLLAIGFALCATQAVAQSSGAAPGTDSPPAPSQSGAAAANTVQDIIVTAQFRRQRLQDTPVAITAVSGKALDARAQTSVTDIGAYAPNVNISPAYSSFGSSINAFIRGVGQNDSNFALEPGVGIYIDDIYYGSTFGAVFDLSDLDRVEVLRGPQGTLAGKNSIGGAVKLYSQKPNGAGGGYVETTTGSFNRIDIRAGADLKLADGLYARLSGVSKHRDGFVTRLDYGCVNPGLGIAASTTGSGCKIGTEGGQDLNAARLAIRYAPTGSRLEVNIIGDVTDDESEPTATKLLYANNPGIRSYVAGDAAAGVPFDSRFLTCGHCYTNYATYENGGNYTTLFGTPHQVTPGTFAQQVKSTVHSWGVSGTIDYDLSDQLKLKSITGYRDAKGFSADDLDGSPLDLGMNASHFSYSQVTQELRLNGKIGRMADYTLGGFYFDSQGVIQQRTEIPTVLLDFLTNDPVDSTSKSVFGHLELHLTPKLNLITGIRYTDDSKTYTFSRRNADGSAISGIPLTDNFTVVSLNGLSATYRGDRVDYRIGLDYRFTEGLMTYAQVSTGYKGGGVNPRPYTAAQVTTFNPETLTTYEVGFKSDFFDRKARVNGALFFNRYKDIQLSLEACPNAPCAMPANAGDADEKGAELEVTLEPARGLTLNAEMGYLDFSYTRVNPATGISKGAIAPFVSRWTSSAGAQYVFDLDTLGTITPRMDLSFVSKFYFDALNDQGSDVKAHSIVNTRVTYETADRLWSAAFGVTNLFDRFYYVGKNDNIVGFGINQGVLGQPREWYFMLKRKF